MSLAQGGEGTHDLSVADCRWLDGVPFLSARGGGHGTAQAVLTRFCYVWHSSKPTIAARSEPIDRCDRDACRRRRRRAAAGAGDARRSRVEAVLSGPHDDDGSTCVLGALCHDRSEHEAREASSPA